MTPTTAPSSLPCVGIVGGGQLARMMYQDAISLDLPLRFMVSSHDETINQLSTEISQGSAKSAADLQAFANTCEVLTVEHELVNLDALLEMEQSGIAVRPSARALQYASDKWKQRTYFSELGLPLPKFAEITNEQDIDDFIAQQPLPIVLKTKRGGYDGRGVWIVNSREEAASVLREVQENNLELFAEECVAIDEELAVVVVRDVNGNCVTYPVVQSIQEDGICREVNVVATDPTPVSEEAQRIATEIAQAIDVCGVMAVELFRVGEQILINEIATRPHNTGHFSIEGAQTSQFENHLRAVAGLPLGETALTAPACVMVNILGGEQAFTEKDVHQVLLIPGLHLHLYGKQWRKGRKLGHVTVCADTLQEARDRAYAAMQILEPQR